MARSRKVIFKKAVLVVSPADILLERLKATGAAGTLSLESVRDLLRRGADVTKGDAAFGRTALHWAVTLNRLDLCQALVAAGADVNARAVNASGYRDDTPALLGAYYGVPVEMIRFLVENGADINAADTKYGFTPLMWALSNSRQEKLVAFLLKNGACIEARTRDGRTVRDVAAAKTHADNHKSFAIFNAHEENLRARKTGSVLRVSTPADMGQQLLKAINCTAPDRNLVNMLIVNGADIHAIDPRSGYNCVHMAALYDHRLLLGTLIDAGADINARVAMQVNGVNTSQWDETALHIAARHGKPVFLQMLIARGADLNQADSRRGWTPLMQIVAEQPRGAIEMIEALLAAGAHTGMRNNEGKTVIDMAAAELAAGTDENMRRILSMLEHYRTGQPALFRTALARGMKTGVAKPQKMPKINKTGGAAR